MIDSALAVADAVQQRLEELGEKFNRYAHDDVGIGFDVEFTMSRHNIPGMPLICYTLICYDDLAAFGHLGGWPLVYEYADPRFPDNLFRDIEQVGLGKLRI